MNDKKDFLSECELRIAAEALRGAVDSMESIPGIDKAAVEKLAKALENAKEPVDSEGLEIIFRRHGVEGRILAERDAINGELQEVYDSLATERKRAGSMANLAGEYGGTISELKQEVKDLLAAKETAYLQGQLDAYKEFVKKSQCWE